MGSVRASAHDGDVETRLAFAAGRMGSWRWDPATDVVVWSPELERLYGMEPGTFSGDFEAYIGSIHPDDRELHAATIARAAADGSDFVVEHRIVRPDGEVRWIEGRGAPVLDDQGAVREWVGVAIDITARIHREEELRERAIETRLAFAAGRMGSWRWDAVDQHGTWSPELEALIGLEPGSYDGTWDAFVGPILREDHDVVRDAVVSAVTEDREFAVRYRVRHTDGSLRWVETRGGRITERDWVGVTIDVTDVTVADEDRRRSEAILRATYDAAPVGLAFMGRDLRIRWINDHLASINGIPGPDHIGQRLSDVLPEIGSVVRPALEWVIEHGEPLLDLELSGETPAAPGVERIYENSIYPVRDDAGSVIGVGVVVVETTVRREAERELRDAHARLEETVARLDALLENGPFGFAFYDRDLRFVGLNGLFAEISGRAVPEHFGRRLAEVMPELGGRLEAAAARVLDGAPNHELEISGSTSFQPGVERHWLLEHYPVRGRDGRLLGVGAMAVDITERKRSEREARLIAAATELLSAQEPAEITLDRTVAICVPDFADSCTLYVNARAGLPRRFAAAHVKSELRDHLVEAEAKWPLDVSKIHAAIPESGSLLAHDLTPAARSAFAPDDPDEIAFAEEHGAASVIAVPLRVGRRELGLVVFAYTDISGRRYREDDRELAVALADRFAQLIENAYLWREAERAQSRLDLLAHISELLTVDLDSQARLETITRVVLPIFADACAVYLPEGTDQLRLAAFASADDGAEAEFDAIEGPPVHSIDAAAPPAVVMRTGKPLLFEHVPPEVLDTLGATSESQRFVRASKIQSLVVAPLPGADGPIGVIGFGLLGAERNYETDDLQLAEEIARRVAPAVENALRYEQQSATAEALQRTLLPETLAEIAEVELAARYIPGSVDVLVGGDWYDAVQLEDGGLLVAIGDVVGHGVRAATWMGKLRTLVQFCALDGLAPAAMLHRLNAYCFSAAGSDMATALVGVYQPEDGTLRLASAGHPPPLVRRADGSTEVVWEGRGPPLCASDAAQYEETEITLEHGDVLVLFTDGLVERRGETFDAGLERLARAVALDAADLDGMADSLTTSLLGTDKPADDVALLLLRPVGFSDGLDLVMATDPRELARLRRSLRHWLGRAGATSEEIGELLVALNEVAANAIEHAYGPNDAHFEVSARLAHGVVEIEVRDSGSWRERPSGVERGRGLFIAEQLTDSLVVDRTPSGTAARLRKQLEGTR